MFVTLAKRYPEMLDMETPARKNNESVVSNRDTKAGILPARSATGGLNDYNLLTKEMDRTIKFKDDKLRGCMCRYYSCLEGANLR